MQTTLLLSAILLYIVLSCWGSDKFKSANKKNCPTNPPTTFLICGEWESNNNTCYGNIDYVLTIYKNGVFEFKSYSWDFLNHSKSGTWSYEESTLSLYVSGELWSVYEVAELTNDRLTMIKSDITYHFERID